LQLVDLPLLAIDGAIERIELVFGEAQLHFEFVEARFHRCRFLSRSLDRL